MLSVEVLFFFCYGTTLEEKFPHSDLIEDNKLDYILEKYILLYNKACSTHTFPHEPQYNVYIIYIRGLDIVLVVAPARDKIAWHCSSSSPVVIPAPV